MSTALFDPRVGPGQVENSKKMSAHSDPNLFVLIRNCSVQFTMLNFAFFRQLASSGVLVHRLLCLHYIQLYSPALVERKSYTLRNLTNLNNEIPLKYTDHSHHI